MECEDIGLGLAVIRLITRGIRTNHIFFFTTEYQFKKQNQ